MDSIIISVAPNGARKTKKDHPGIPLTPEEIADEAEACYKAGAALIHLHVRDEKQKHTLDVNTYKQAVKAIKDRMGNKLIIQCTTEAVGIYNPDQQMEMVRELKPEAASLAIREIIPDRSYEKKAADFLKFLITEKIHPQFILYSPKEVECFADLIERCVIPAEQRKYFVLFVLGKKNAPNAASAYAQPEDLHPFLKSYEKFLKNKNVIWGCCAFGGNENACMIEVIKNGGHPRIGFENNHLLADGSIAASNAELIKQFVASTNSYGRKIASTEEAKAILNSAC